VSRLNPRAPQRPRLVLIAVVAILAVTLPSSSASGEEAVPGGAGTDTSLPATPSQVTVNGRGDFSTLRVTVNQTRNLVNQAVSITWTGGRPTAQGPGRFAADYLQVMQCWSDDDGLDPTNPGPPPEQCVYGARAGTYGGLPAGIYPNGLTMTRVMTRRSWANYRPTEGFLEASTGNVWRPFRAVDGTVVNAHTDPFFNPSVVGGNFWLNPYFNSTTTNELSASATGPNGAGSDLFTVDTGVESTGLGCGQRLVPAGGGAARTPKCWIVVVPRGSAVDENAGTPFADQASQFGVVTSPLTTEAWENRIAIPISFNPVDSPCSLAASDRRLIGSELATPAISSWQPRLCSAPGRPPYSYANVSDAAARQQIVEPAAGAPGMAITPRPIDPATVSADSPVVYAPVTLSGAVIGFNVERNPRINAPQAEQDLSGVRVAELNLTPRLVAKLLTQSYRQQVEIVRPPQYPWLASNPAHLGLDPDFIRFNPEFSLLQISGGKNFGGLMLPGGNSDVAHQVWEWVLADPEARAWLDGIPDEWGMRVNPVYATRAAVNSSDVAFGVPTPDSFPKADPYCYTAPPRGPNNSIVPAPLCGTDWLPYTQSMRTAARQTRVADDLAKIVENVFAISSDQVWTKDQPQYLGRRAILSLTDTASAAQYGVQVARLSRAGDNGDDRSFIAPDTDGLTAGVAAMRPGDEPDVLEADPATTGPEAYPLTSLTYAALRPLELDAQARTDYAAFIDYAAGPGQVVGLELGQLPLGYAPLPERLRQQAIAAAETVRTLQPAGEEPPPPTTPDPGPSSGFPSPSSGPDQVASGPPASVPTDAETPTAEISATPVVAFAGSGVVLPALAFVALLAGYVALEITKRNRRGVVEEDPS
jgi:hypothetical protein